MPSRGTMEKQGKEKVGTFGIGNFQTAVLDSVNNNAQNTKFYFTETAPVRSKYAYGQPDHNSVPWYKIYKQT